jgi:integrase
LDTEIQPKQASRGRSWLVLSRSPTIVGGKDASDGQARKIRSRNLVSISIRPAQLEVLVSDVDDEDLPDTDVVVSDDLELLRSYELDALSSILPPDRRDKLAEILTDDDVATLKHLAKEGMGRNTLRAIASDLHYLESWADAATRTALPWPAPEALILKFIAHHLYDAAEHLSDPTHGMPQNVIDELTARGCLRTVGPHAPSTVRRRLALWSTLHRWRGLRGPFSEPIVKTAIRLAGRAAKRPRGRKSANPVTRDVLDKLVATCATERLVDVRDRALLLAAFGSGGRRRSEIASVMVHDLVARQPIAADTEKPDGAYLPVLGLHLGRTKTAGLEQDERVLLIGRPVEAVKEWLLLSLITQGPVFRAIDRFGRVGDRALDGQSVNAILKKRCLLAGLPKTGFSAHGLRSGYLTEAARKNVPLQEAMRQSRHSSVQQASSYYNEVEMERGNSARLA